MSNFSWDRKQNPAAPQAQQVFLDEEALSEIQGDPELDLFPDGDLEEEENESVLMNDVNLRLEQGRLYQMVLQGNIFADTNADPRAIRNVQREIHRFVRERMEIMVGIKQEQAAQQTTVSSPFNDLEVTVLKMLASKMSKGATEEQSPPPVQASPKKDGISSISGNLRPNAPLTASKPMVRAPQPAKLAPKQTQKPATKAKSAIAPDESTLQKPIEEMTPEELLAHNKAAEERSRKKYATMPTNLVPHPTPQALEMMYTQSATNLTIANPWRN